MPFGTIYSECLRWLEPIIHSIRPICSNYPFIIKIFNFAWSFWNLFSWCCTIKNPLAMEIADACLWCSVISTSNVNRLPSLFHWDYRFSALYREWYNWSWWNHTSQEDHHQKGIILSNVMYVPFSGKDHVPVFGLSSNRILWGAETVIHGEQDNEK